MCNFLRKNVVVTVIFVPTYENGEERFIRVCFSFFVLVFHTKSATTINHRIELIDI